jgi:hypothetical protein
MQSESARLIDQAVDLAFHMKGGLTYTEAFDLTHTERLIVARYIERHYENERKAMDRASGKQRV